jgi:hypothetical protein
MRLIGSTARNAWTQSFAPCDLLLDHIIAVRSGKSAPAIRRDALASARGTHDLFSKARSTPLTWLALLANADNGAPKPTVHDRRPYAALAKL